MFGQKNGSIKVEPLPAILVRFSPKFLVLEDPLSWADLAACSAPTGEAEAGTYPVSARIQNLTPVFKI